MNKNLCNLEYLNQIVSAIEDYFYFTENANSNDLENAVKEEVEGVALDFSLQTWY